METAPSVVRFWILQLFSDNVAGYSCITFCFLCCLLGLVLKKAGGVIALCFTVVSDQLEAFFLAIVVM